MHTLNWFHIGETEAKYEKSKSKGATAIFVAERVPANPCVILRIFVCLLSVKKCGKKRQKVSKNDTQEIKKAL